MPPLNALESRIATLIASDDFAELIRNMILEKKGRLATWYVQSRAASSLGGSTRPKTHMVSPRMLFGSRRYDINCRDKVIELKFRGDPVKRREVRRDLWFMKYNPRDGAPFPRVWYLFIDGPFGERPRSEDFQRLDTIPYVHWTWSEFLHLTATLNPDWTYSRVIPGTA
jgi:hypothetical protein